MTAPGRVTLVTGTDLPGPDAETPLLAQALRSLGIEPDIASWREPHDWHASALLVLRTPWDYVDHLPAFRAWIAQVDRRSRLRNPADVVLWNLHKRYLLQLAAHGVAIVPTRLFEPGHAGQLAQALVELAQDAAWHEVVAKPAIGINAVGSMRAMIDDPALAAHLTALLRTGDALLQPFLPGITREGELSLVFVEGAYTHAVRKQPRAGDYRVQDNHGGSVHPYEPTASEIALARAALACAPSPTTYARVDLASVDGAPAVMELELIEPELFLRYSPSATLALARAIARLLHAGH